MQSENQTKKALDKPSPENWLTEETRFQGK